MSSFGTNYRVHTYGESHCKSVGAIIDGVPPGLKLTNEDIQVQLSRRRPGQSDITTPRSEFDTVQIQSGTEHGVTLGTPIGLLVQNKDQRPHDYTETDLYPRPSHADYTYLAKYGVKASSGGGRASARETIGRVAAGAIAEKYLKEALGVDIVAYVSSVGNVSLPFAQNDDEVIGKEYLELLSTVTREQVDKEITRCPHKETSEKMEAKIREAKGRNDSLGGTITCVIRNPPLGLGEPCFDKLEAVLAHAMLSIPSTKGFEIGSGFRGAEYPGSVHNDPFEAHPDGGNRLRTTTNWSGGIQGGISNGEDIYFRVAFKPPATISQEQSTAQYDGTSGTLATRGRHDPCVLPRAIPIVETMAAIVIMDMVLQQNARKAASSLLPPVDSLPPTMVFPGQRKA
ncbi:chorismate synthase [Trichosporon asahii var. asahii CBS 8904]|uniref:Chorismate synthase n=2 Tax=Trichosporon asahii var. asahii TaxID=189963 RepID=K1VAF3_TRIAC|nr:chorismate synthase [Trichosporon asahii var. asahii CBS 2479]EJT46001.1 chorismate synthase [Trichosporon asahii var. asahii CBS 2479]EKD01010.1 chorismate synthase [Trichosporon asahii var. asahii CBS 8904]